MKYPEKCKNVIDVTKAPYYADNTGKTNVTDVLIQAIDDCLRGYITELEKTKQKLLRMAEEQGGNVYIGAEAARIVNDNILITFPDDLPQAKFLFFPEGEYLVSDTVCYTFDNLHTRQQLNYYCELCRCIHIVGENREKTVIRLADNSAGFEAGKEKPLLSFNKVSKDDIETTNCAQMNTLEDITIDCGSGNDGAVGVLYSSSNVGRIENVTIRANGGVCGIKFDYESEGCVRDLTVSGFDYGIKTGHTSPIVFDDIDLSQNRIAGIRAKDANLIFNNAVCGDIPAFEFVKGEYGRYCIVDDVKYIGDKTGNYIFKKENDFIKLNRPWPKRKKYESFENWACVDDFGAVADGVTDCTNAIQRAMNSGKEVIYFGEGCYLISRTIKIPKTVKTVDFMYTSIIPGYSLIIGEMEGMFDICEESEEMFFAEHFIPGERYSGFFRMFKHSAHRPAVFGDISISSSIYFNTVQDNEVYFDNCFTMTSHYAFDGLHRDGYVPVFCRVIPVELHNQKAYGRNLNIERAELELLNDNSELLVDGYKVEGAGMILKSVNGGKTQLNLFNAAWWGNCLSENCMFTMENASAHLTGGHIFCYSDAKELRTALCIRNDGEETKTELYDCSRELKGKDALGRDLGRLIETLRV